MFVEITKAYTSKYPDPICFAAGAELNVGRCDPEFPGWFWCRSSNGTEGWVHRSFLAAWAGMTTSLLAYTAMELTVTGGERGALLQSLDGWTYLRLDDGSEGWIPESHVA